MKTFSRRHKRLFVLAVMMLLAGIINYYLFQPHIKLFGYFIHPPYLKLDRTGWAGRLLTGYLGDILWCMALVLTTVILSERKHLHLSGRICILMVPFVSEFAQAAGIINGVFDWLDINVYLVTELVSFILFPGLLSPHYEK